MGISIPEPYEGRGKSLSCNCAGDAGGERNSLEDSLGCLGCRDESVADAMVYHDHRICDTRIGVIFLADYLRTSQAL